MPLPPKPTDAPDWATGATFTGGPYPGQANKATPTGGQITEGFQPKTFFAVEWINYLFNLLGTRWMNYVVGITDAIMGGTASHKAIVIDGTGDLLVAPAAGTLSVTPVAGGNVTAIVGNALGLAEGVRGNGGASGNGISGHTLSASHYAAEVLSDVTAGIALHAANTVDGASGLAFVCAGRQQMGSDDPASTVALKNTVTNKNVCKAWGMLQPQAGGVVNIIDGFNIASATQVTINTFLSVQIAWAQPFASATYIVILTNNLNTQNQAVTWEVYSQTSTLCTIVAYVGGSQIAVNTTPVNMYLSVMAFGQQ